MTIDLELTHFFEQVEIPEDEMENLLKIASWQIEPQFPYPGRTAWHVLEKPAFLKSDKTRKYYAAKLKGVGVWNPGNAHLYSGVHHRQGASSEAPIPPTTEEYKFTASIAHMGFTECGCFEEVHSEPAPFGGILHRRAVQEFENASRLLACGVPAVTPLFVAKLPDCYKFMNQDMGIVCVMSEEAKPYRLHLIHFGEGELTEPEHKYYTELRQAIGISGDISDEDTRLRVINALVRQIGKRMHDFSAAGLYRYSGGWEDLQFCIEKKELFLVDLDSSRCLSELPSCTRSLQMLRDISSSIHKLLNTFYYPTVMDKYTFSNLVAYDPIAAMLSAYFPASKDKKIKKASKLYWDYFAPHLFMMKRYKDQVLGDCEGERRKSYKMDDDIFYTLSILALFPLYCESDLNSIYPSECTLEDLRGRARVFLGERYQYLSYLLAD